MICIDKMVTWYAILCVFTSCVFLGLTPAIIYDAVTREMTTGRIASTVCLSVIAITSLCVAIASFRMHRTIVRAQDFDRKIAKIYAEPDSTPSANKESEYYY